MMKFKNGASGSRFIRILLIVFSVLFLFSLCNFIAAYAAQDGEEGAYYFDSNAADGGDGSLSRPFNSLDEIDGLKLSAGNKIYIRKDSKFNGGLRLCGLEGAENNPIEITSYGEGAMPRINGNNSEGEGVLYIENCSYITVSDLEICDTATYQADRRGVLVYGKSEGDAVTAFRGITLDGLYVHDIRGFTSSVSDKSGAADRTGGIQVWTDENSRFDKLTITNCRITNVDNAGIAVWRLVEDEDGAISPYSDEFAQYACTDTVISCNEISYVGKNGITVQNLLGGVIENNVIFETSLNSASGNTIFTSYVYGTVVQYNEGYLNRAFARTDGERDGLSQDGSMLNAGLRSRDTVWQYNYSHDNSFGLFLSAKSENEEAGSADSAIVRYNLSVNDKGADGIVYIDNKGENLQIYNNTFFCGANTSPVILKVKSSSSAFSFFNNIIYNNSASASFSIPSGAAAGIIISDNLVYSQDGAVINGLDGFKALNADGIYSDPLFSGTTGATVKERAGMENAVFFQVKPDSAALSSGKSVSGVSLDFFGNAYKPSIGFYCGEGNENAEIIYELDADGLREYRYTDVSVISDIVYGTAVNYKGGTTTLKLDIYSADDCTDRNRPLVVLIHGGGFRSDSSKTQGYIVKLANLLAKKGYAVASIEYRLRSGSDMPEDEDEIPALMDAAEDANTAINWLREKGGVYAYNPDYIFVAGGSAGGRTAMAYAFAEDERGFNKDGIVAVGNLWGGPEDWFSSCYDSDFSQDDLFPTVFVHGTGDTTINYNYSKAVYEALTARGAVTSWNPIEGAEHSLIGYDTDYTITCGIISQFFADRLKDKIAADGGFTQPPKPEDREEVIVTYPQSTDEIIYPNADMYVHSNSSGKYASFADSEVLCVYDSANNQYLRKSYMRFDTVMGTKGAYVAKVALNFNVVKADNVSPSNPQTINVYAIGDNNWFANEITWVNQPDESSKTLLGRIVVTGTGEYRIDITNYVLSAQQTGIPTITLMLESNAAPSTSQKTDIASYESISNAPYLDCEYSSEMPEYKTLTVNVVGDGSADVSSCRVISGSSYIVSATPSVGSVLKSASADTSESGVTVSREGNLITVGNIVRDTVLTLTFADDNSAIYAVDSSTVQYGYPDTPVINGADSGDASIINPLYVCTKGAANDTSRISWIKFDISDFDFAGKSVNFEIYCYKTVEFNSNTMPVDVYATTFTEWDGSTFCWGKQPVAIDSENLADYKITFGAQKVGSFVVKDASCWYSVDITDYVLALSRSGFTQFSLALVDADAETKTPLARFVSAQATAVKDGVSLRPRLLTSENEGVEGDKIDINIEITNSAHGTVSGGKGVENNGSAVLEIVPEEGYGAIVTVDGQTRKVYGNRLYLSCVTEETEVSVSFAKLYSVTVEGGENVTLEAENLTVAKNDKAVIRFSVAAGHKAVVKVNGAVQEFAGNTIKITVIQDIKITVEAVSILN